MIRAELPIVRPRALPGADDPLAWREGADLPSVAVVMLVGAIGGFLGFGNLARGATGDAALVAGVFLLIGVFAIGMAFMELARLERIDVDHGVVIYTFRGFGGRRSWREPLSAYQGLSFLDRQRRWFVRNQGLPATGRRGPVSEYVVVLRHKTDRSRDLELFRAQPALGVLRTMHVAGASRGRTDVQEVERVAGLYRDALAELCTRLKKPALIETEGGGIKKVDARSLNMWLEPT